MKTALALVVLTAAATLAQELPDLSGRWQLVAPTAAQMADETLSVTAAKEMYVTQTARDITITQSPRDETKLTHPETGTFQYGGGGFVSTLPGTSTVVRGQWGVSNIGTQLMFSRTTAYPPDATGIGVTVARGSMWRLEGADTLVIEFGEERAGERPKIATRVYRRLPP